MKIAQQTTFWTHDQWRQEVNYLFNDRKWTISGPLRIHGTKNLVHIINIQWI